VKGICRIGCSNGPADTAVLAYAPKTPFVKKLMDKVKTSVSRYGVNFGMNLWNSSKIVCHISLDSFGYKSASFFCTQMWKGSKMNWR
jgi:hypothetical protein